MAKKTTKKESTARKAPSGKVTGRKSTKAAAGKVSKKKTTRKKTAKKVTSKKVAKKASAGKTLTKKVTKNPVSKKPVSKKKVTRKAAVKAKPVREVPPKKIKTTLSKAELKSCLALLLEKRAELLGDIGTMEEGALRNYDQSNLSNMPLHMADVGSDNYDQELLLGLVESERKLLKEIDEAIGRIGDKTYGMCLKTGKPINKARLEIKPWAKYSIEVAREMERSGGVRF